MENNHLMGSNVVTMVDILNKERGACYFYFIKHFILYIVIKKQIRTRRVLKCSFEWK